MTNEQLKNRTQQIIDAIPVLREKEYGWAEIEKMLNEILIELDDSPWHAGRLNKFQASKKVDRNLKEFYNSDIK